MTTGQAAGFIYPTRDVRANGEVAATVNVFGKGKVGAVYGALGAVYFRSHHPWLREFVGQLVTGLFPNPAVTVEAPPTLDVALRRTAGGRLSVHLPQHGRDALPDRYGFTDFIPPLEHITLTIKTAERPTSVVWVPDGGRLEWSWADGWLKVTVPGSRSTASSSGNESGRCGLVQPGDQVLRVLDFVTQNSVTKAISAKLWKKSLCQGYAFPRGCSGPPC